MIQSADKTVRLYLAAPGSGATLGLSNAVLSIVDDDFLPGRINLTANAYSTNEQGVALIVPVTRTGGNSGVLDISYATSNLTAVAGVNYLAVSGSLHWDDGDTSTRLITIPILHDPQVTPNRQFVVGLFNPSVPGSAGSRVVATNTIALQEQLVERDIPLLKGTLAPAPDEGEHAHPDQVRIVPGVAAGRAHQLEAAAGGDVLGVDVVDLVAEVERQRPLEHGHRDRRGELVSSPASSTSTRWMWPLASSAANRPSRSPSRM